MNQQFSEYFQVKYFYDNTQYHLYMFGEDHSFQQAFLVSVQDEACTFLHYFQRP